VHVERRRPHDAEARDETWRMWVHDRLNHDVAPRETERIRSAETTNRAADALGESIDSPDDHHV
jgi:hypothetical protein